MPISRTALTVLLVLPLAALVGGCKKPMEDFTSTEWKFKARFPGKPKEETKTQNSPAGALTFHMFSTNERNGAFMVGVADMPGIPANPPADQVQAMLDGGEKGEITSMQATLKDSKNITLGGKYPGREFSATITQPKQGLVRARVYLVGNRLYQIFIAGTDSFATSKEANEFLDSFQLIE